MDPYQGVWRCSYHGGMKGTYHGGGEVIPLCKVVADLVNAFSLLAPLFKGGADVVSRGVDSNCLIYTKTNKELRIKN